MSLHENTSANTWCLTGYFLVFAYESNLSKGSYTPWWGVKVGYRSALSVCVKAGIGYVAFRMFGSPMCLIDYLQKR